MYCIALCVAFSHWTHCFTLYGLPQFHFIVNRMYTIHIRYFIFKTGTNRKENKSPDDLFHWHTPFVCVCVLLCLQCVFRILELDWICEALAHFAVPLNWNTRPKSKFYWKQNLLDMKIESSTPLIKMSIHCQYDEYEIHVYYTRYTYT